MGKKLRRAPKCPECGEPLEMVNVETCGEHYCWNCEKGVYEIDDISATLTFYCPSCGKPIGGWRDGENWGFIPEFE